jgi:hypothetical protein
MRQPTSIESRERLRLLSAMPVFSIADAEVAVRNLVNERHFYGSYCEIGAYEWLFRHHVAFRAQIRLSGSDILNPKGSIIDGRFGALDGYFDIKGMGFQAYVAEVFQERLQNMLPGFIVGIEGPMDVAVKDIETHAFGQLSTLAQKLASGGIEEIPQLRWTVRATPPSGFTTTVQTIDSYKLAAENRHFPFKSAGQFTRNAPFVLVFAYAAQFNHGLFLNYAASSEITLRALARRVFIQLTYDLTPAAQFDSQVGSGALVADAVRLISGLMFINLDKEEAWFFLNPRATHRLTKSHVEQIFDFSQPSYLAVDDFAHDDY